MKIQISNKHIFFAVDNCWQILHYRFKTQLNEIVSANSDLSTIQQIDIDKETFLLIMNTVNTQPQGIAKDINPKMYDDLKIQVLTLANLGDAEAIEIATSMAVILQENNNVLNEKIEKSKQQILA